MATLAKMVTKTLDVGVSNTTIDLSATIKSFDVLDTKFIFGITSNQGLAINLSGATVKYIVEYYVEGKTYAIEGNCLVVDINTISFNLPDQLRGYNGKALIGIYATLTDGTKIDIKDIAVRIEPSIMDKDIDFSAKTYFKDFEKVKAEVILEGEKAKTDIKAIVADVQSTGDTAKEDIKSTLPTLQNQVSELKSDLTHQKEYIFEDIPKAINISEIENITFKEGWNAADDSSSIPMSKIASYDTYYFITTRDCDIYVKSVSAGYFAIIYGGQYQSIFENDNSFIIYCDGGSKRVRNIDGNLPTETNKLHITKGSVVAFTISHGADQAIYGFDKGIKVKDSFKEEIITSIPSNKKSYVQYVTGYIEGSASEGLNIFLPTKVGYIRYAFVHTVSDSLHADVWRIHRAYAVDDSFNDRFLLTTTGEWEMAVHLPNRADFSGGYAHGDEIMGSITFIVDGSITDITALTNRTEFNRLEIIQDSDVYDPNDSTTIYAKHGSKHIFDSKMNDHLVIEQALRFTSEQTMTTCYMAMFPPAKKTTNAYYEDINFKDTLITTYPIVVDKAREVTIHSEDVGFVARFSIPKTVETSNLTGGNHLKIHDNGGSDYNKCYYTLCGDANVSADEVWKTQTNYNLEMVK